MTDTNEKPLHVVELRAENLKRLTAVRIAPGGAAVVVVGGRNAQGKSSCLDAIEMALAGTRAIPAEPIRHGARRARIVLDLDEIVVERTFTAKGSELVVKSKDGVPQKSPQALLDSLTSKIAFDPVAFLRMEPKKQDEILKRVVGVDFSQLDREREQIFTARTNANRDLKQLEARLAALPMPAAGLPEREVSVRELFDELATRQATQSENEAKRAALRLRKEEHGAVADSIVHLQSQLAKAQAEEGRLAGVIVDLERDVDALVDPDPAEVRRKLDGVEQTNAQIRKNTERTALDKQITELGARVESMADAIAGIDERKAEQLAAAKFPVEGLGFDETGPTLQGVPLEQGSQAEKLRLAVAICAALNPRARVVLVRDGSLLDDDSMRLLAELSAKHDLQTWIERVGDGASCTVVIEDGSVKHAEADTAAGQ